MQLCGCRTMSRLHCCVRAGTTTGSCREGTFSRGRQTRMALWPRACNQLNHIIFRAFLMASSAVIEGSVVKRFLSTFCDMGRVKPSITRAPSASS